MEDAVGFGIVGPPCVVPGLSTDLDCWGCLREGFGLISSFGMDVVEDDADVAERVSEKDEGPSLGICFFGGLVEVADFLT